MDGDIRKRCLKDTVLRRRYDTPPPDAFAALIGIILQRQDYGQRDVRPDLRQPMFSPREVSWRRPSPVCPDHCSGAFTSEGCT